MVSPPAGFFASRCRHAYLVEREGMREWCGTLRGGRTTGNGPAPGSDAGPAEWVGRETGDPDNQRLLNRQLKQSPHFHV